MKASRPFEEVLLESAMNFLDAHCGTNHELRLEVLEAASSRHGGFSLSKFRKLFDLEYKNDIHKLLEVGEGLLREIGKSPISAPLALSALARSPLQHVEQKKLGAYYTDFRLAQFLTKGFENKLVPGSKVVDPSAGTGILLVASSLAACESDRIRSATWLAESIFAMDLSSEAIRGARLALASLTDDLGAVIQMASRWKVTDSLLDDGLDFGKFDLVLGNPPWEKIKTTRHEHAQSKGEIRHYGDDHKGSVDKSFLVQKRRLQGYSDKITERYPLLGSGESDLYKAFIELSLKLARPDGSVGLLVPAGLIRSQGTYDLRNELVEKTGELEISILENKERFFAIDTRFKFLKLAIRKNSEGHEQGDILLRHASGLRDGVQQMAPVVLGKNTLRKLRPDLSVPEVRSETEWKIFKKMSEKSIHKNLKDSPWYSEFSREVDMTRDREFFKRKGANTDVPVVEGRMVQQHRFGAKVYRTGTGRKARWDTVQVGSKIGPQFWISKDYLNKAQKLRMGQVRVGFCDITGQTNERSMMAALVPRGVVCGNKVPTVVFPNDPSEARKYLWLAVVNSLPFDWALRRIVTNTINYFILRSVPFPDIEPNSFLGRRLVELSRALNGQFDGTERGAWGRARAKAEIDILVFSAYGLEFNELSTLLRDFPLLDRGQPPILSEIHSTITKDLLLLSAANMFGRPGDEYQIRVDLAENRGATPYVPEEFSVEEDSLQVENLNA